MYSSSNAPSCPRCQELEQLVSEMTKKVLRGTGVSHLEAELSYSGDGNFMLMNSDGKPDHHVHLQPGDNLKLQLRIVYG